MKQILLINSTGKNEQAIDSLIAEFQAGDYIFFRTGKNFCCGSSIDNFQKETIFLLFFPFLLIIALVNLAKFFYLRQIKTIVCFGLNDKLMYTVWARFFKIKVIWLEFPNTNYQGINKIIFWLYKKLSQRALLVAFCSQTKKHLESLSVTEESISLIFPGVVEKKLQYQENIFNSLVQKDRSDYRRKYFTIGTILELNKKERMETIFYALKSALQVVPNLQLIIIGEGPEKKNLTWLAKKIKIENLVWFVGEQKYIKKWLESFDLLLVSAEKPELFDLNNVLEAMSVGLPVIGPLHQGLEDLVYENKTGSLISMDNSEMLARQIIKLHQEKNWRLNLGQMGRSRAEEYFSLKNTIDNFKQIL